MRKIINGTRYDTEGRAAGLYTFAGTPTAGTTLAMMQKGAPQVSIYLQGLQPPALPGR